MKYLKITIQERDRKYQALEMYWNMPRALRVKYVKKILGLENLIWHMNKVLIR